MAGNESTSRKAGKEIIMNTAAFCRDSFPNETNFLKQQMTFPRTISQREKKVTIFTNVELKQEPNASDLCV